MAPSLTRQWVITLYPWLLLLLLLWEVVTRLGRKEKGSLFVWQDGVQLPGPRYLVKVGGHWVYLSRPGIVEPALLLGTIYKTTTKTQPTQRLWSHLYDMT
jgi:hypothetical protein